MKERRITVDLLEECSACRWQIRLFREMWPNGCRPTLYNLRRALAAGLDVWWWIGRASHRLLYFDNPPLQFEEEINEALDSMQKDRINIHMGHCSQHYTLLKQFNRKHRKEFEKVLSELQKAWEVCEK